MIEELHCKTRIDRGLIGIRLRPRDLIQAEAGQQVRFVGNPVVDPNGELIRSRGDFGIRRVGVFAISTCRMIR